MIKSQAANIAYLIFLMITCYWDGTTLWFVHVFDRHTDSDFNVLSHKVKSSGKVKILLKLFYHDIFLKNTIRTPSCWPVFVSIPKKTRVYRKYRFLYYLDRSSQVTNPQLSPLTTRTPERDYLLQMVSNCDFFIRNSLNQWSSILCFCHYFLTHAVQGLPVLIQEVGGSLREPWFPQPMTNSRLDIPEVTRKWR